MRVGQTEFKERTKNEHRTQFSALFCRVCGASMREGDGYNSINYNGINYEPIPLEAHHLEPYRKAGHNTRGALLCSACHSLAHSGHGELSPLGKFIKKIL